MEQKQLNLKIYNYFKDRLERKITTIDFIKFNQEKAVQQENYELAEAIRYTLERLQESNIHG